MKYLLAVGFLFLSGTAVAGSLDYWNLFNIEGESTVTAQFASYGSSADMFADTNRLGVFTPITAGGAGRNIVGSGSDGTLYWNLFNIEGESAVTAQFASYGSSADMFADTNRLGVFTPITAGGAGRNIVGSGSDGTLYWNLFNIEGESAVTAQFASYGSSADMFADTNRLGVFTPITAGGAGRNIVGSGSDGTLYWNLFNIEGESAVSAQFASYGSSADMFADTNRLGVFTPITAGGAGRNIVGSGGAFFVDDPAIPEPSSLTLLGLGVALTALRVRRRRRT